MKNTVIIIVNIEAPAMTSPKLTNCAAPAKTTADIAIDCQMDKPALTAIEPAKIPHGKTAIDKGKISRAP